MDQLLRYMALEGVTAHWDGYSTANNYRIYTAPPDGRFEWIPWGTDQTWGWSGYSPYGGYGLVFTYCLANAACAARFDEALLEMVDLVDSLPLEAEMDDAVAWLYPEIAADPRRESSDDTLWATVETTRWHLTAWQDEVRAQAGG